MTLQLWSCSKFWLHILHQHLFGQFLVTVLDCLCWLRVSLKNDTIWIVNMAPCETPRVAVAWPLPTILINRFERRYNALRLLGCQTTVEILVFPMGQNFWRYCEVNAKKVVGGLGNWFLWPFLLKILSSDVCFAIFVGSPFTCAGTPRRFFWWFFATTVIPSPLPGPYVHEQFQGLLQVPGPLASTPHHPIDHARKFDPHAFCPQPHHPLRSIYNVTTSRNIYIPPPHTIESVTSIMFASSMNFNITPHTIHCVASTMIMFASSRIASSIDCEEA